MTNQFVDGQASLQQQQPFFQLALQNTYHQQQPQSLNLLAQPLQQPTSVDELVVQQDGRIGSGANLDENDLSFWELHMNKTILYIDPKGTRLDPPGKVTREYMQAWYEMLERLVDYVQLLGVQLEEFMQQKRLRESMSDANAFLEAGGQTMMSMAGMRDESWGGSAADQLDFRTVGDQSGGMLPHSDFYGMPSANQTSIVGENGSNNGGSMGYDQYRQLMQQSYHDSLPGAGGSGYIDESSGLYMPEFMGVSNIQQQQMASQRDAYMSSVVPIQQRQSASMVDNPMKGAFQ